MSAPRYFLTQDYSFLPYTRYKYGGKVMLVASTMASTPRPPSPEVFQPPPTLVLKQRMDHDDSAAEAKAAAAQEAAMARLPGEISELVADSAEAAITHDPLKVSEAVADALKVMQDVEIVADCRCFSCLGWMAWRRSGAHTLAPIISHAPASAPAPRSRSCSHSHPRPSSPTRPLPLPAPVPAAAAAAPAPTLAMAVAPPSRRTLAPDAGPASVFSFLK